MRGEPPEGVFTRRRCLQHVVWRGLESYPRTLAWHGRYRRLSKGYEE